MENELKTEPNPRDESRGRYEGTPRRPRVVGALIVILVGVALLMKQIPSVSAALPGWLFTWPMILILIGVVALLRTRSFGALIPVLIGVFFLLQNENMIAADLRPFVVPVLIILFGIMLLFNRNQCRRRQACFAHRVPRGGHGFRRNWKNDGDVSREDYVDINSMFGSVEKTVLSKHFKGGEVTCAFGGGKLDLTKADIDESAIINVAVNFGGAEIIIPGNWNLQNELNVLLGGIEDKRRGGVGDEENKTLILRGSVFCGGIEILN